MSAFGSAEQRAARGDDPVGLFVELAPHMLVAAEEQGIDPGIASRANNLTGLVVA
jgi:hypothetical protein